VEEAAPTAPARTTSAPAGDLAGTGQAPSAGGDPGRNRVQAGESLTVLLVAACLATAWFYATWSGQGPHTVGSGGDSYPLIWGLGWWPYALSHGLNPFFSHRVQYPHGANLMWLPPTVPLLSLLLSPLTVVTGPVTSYNVLATAAPALTTWAAYLAFRRWTMPGSALLGALIFGFSPYMAAQSNDHPFLTFLVTAPLMLIVADRLLVVQEAPAWRDGLWLGLLAAAQLLISEEILVMEAIAALAGVVVLCLLGGRQVPRRALHAAKGLAVALGVWVVVSAYPLAVQFLGPDRLLGQLQPRGVYVGDVWNFITPTSVTALDPVWAHRLTQSFTGNYTEWGAYLGIPLLIFLVLAVVLCWRSRLTWVALAVTVVSGVLTLGGRLHVAGHPTHIPLPWGLVDHLPVLEDLLPLRFSSMLFLGAGLLVALGVDALVSLPARPPGRPRRVVVVGSGLVVLILISLVPRLPFRTNSLPSSKGLAAGWVCPRRAGAPVELLPSSDEAVLYWQAEAGYCFSMPARTGLNVSRDRGALPDPVLAAASAAAETAQRLPPVTPALRDAVKAELARQGAVEVLLPWERRVQALTPALRVATQAELSRLGVRDHIVSKPTLRGTQMRLADWLTSVLRVSPSSVGGVLVWRVRRPLTGG